MDKIIMKIFNFLSYNEDLKKDRPVLYDMLFTIKIVFITIPFLILITTFVFIPLSIINMFKK